MAKTTVYGPLITFQHRIVVGIGLSRIDGFNIKFDKATTSTLVEALDHQFVAATDPPKRSQKIKNEHPYRCSQKFVSLGCGFNFGLCLGLWLRQAFHRFCSLFVRGDGTGQGLGRFHQIFMVTSRGHASLQIKDGVVKGIFL